MKKMICGFFILFVCVALVKGESDSIIHQDTRVSYSLNNYIVFHDIGRRENGNSIWAGTSCQFTWHYNGHVTVCGPFQTSSFHHPVLLSSQVLKIAFRDESHIWVVSRIGKNFDGCVLIDLQDSGMEKAFVGNDFKVSPDGRHLAFAYPASRPGEYYFLIDDILIYHQVEEGYKTDESGPKQQYSGKRAYQIIDWSRVSYFIPDKMEWKSDKELVVSGKAFERLGDKMSMQEDESSHSVEARYELGMKDGKTTVTRNGSL